MNEIPVLGRPALRRLVVRGLTAGAAALVGLPTVTAVALTGIDLVIEQIQVASGGPLSVSQADIKVEGHAIECRINAEDPKTFMPSPGLVKHYHAPGGNGVRVDSHLYSGYKVPPNYDSLIAKLITWAPDRSGAMDAQARALQGTMTTPGVQVVNTGQTLNVTLPEGVLFATDSAAVTAAASEPTPQAAPVTITGPSFGVSPCFSSASTESIAVKPAVPIAIASRARASTGGRRNGSAPLAVWSK